MGLRWLSKADYLLGPSLYLSLISVRISWFVCASGTHNVLADRDGTLDMLFATCASVSTSTGVGSMCSINIAYNKQLPLCTSNSASNVQNGKPVCRLPDDLCTADPDFQFDLRERADNDVRRSNVVYGLLLICLCFARHSSAYLWRMSSLPTPSPPALPPL